MNSNTKFTLLFFTLVFCIMNCLIISSNAVPYQNDEYPLPKEIGTITEMPNTPLPTNITMPNGRKFKFLLSGVGVQIYECVVNHGIPNNWTLVTPDAFAVNDKRSGTFIPVAHHYFTPNPINGGRIAWESIVEGDNSLLVLKIIATNASPDGPTNLPWLAMEATHHEGTGRFSDITNIIRINTQYGVSPPVDQCGTKYQDGAIVKKVYYTNYWFFH